MPRFAANLSLMFTEWPFLERFEVAAACGFTGVEYLSPYSIPAKELAQRLQDAGLQQTLFNLSPGDRDAGERGLAALPGRQAEFRETLQQALEYAAILDCRHLHVMAGIPHADEPLAACREVYLDNLRHASEEAAKLGCCLLIEPINQRDMPGYFLSHQDDAMTVLREVGAENLRLQFDLYHCQIMEGDLERHLEEQLPQISYIQVAGVPGRHEPSVGEVNYPYLFNVMDALGYDGWVGCEYHPASGTLEGLEWAREYGISPRLPGEKEQLH
ncbi:2-oxo-tetronate isomerase [Fodinicurvata halophila]|uniref:2-oxo-tetronate isomerase n=1 Tax=Fodinicurvata halophila TaxID=1419723 RepID=A0ABV8UPM9_9PROT